MRAIIDSYDCPFCDLDNFPEGYIIDRYSVKEEDKKVFLFFNITPDNKKLAYKICWKHTEESTHETENLISLLKELIISVANNQKNKELQHELRIRLNYITKHNHNMEDF